MAGLNVKGKNLGCTSDNIRYSGLQVDLQQCSWSKGRGLKEPVERGESRSGYKTGATAKVSTT